MSRPVLLLIDDEEDFHDILRQVLEPEGFDLRSALDGPSGLDAARAGPPDLVILDVNMPAMDGYEVCKALRGEPALAEVPVLMLTIRNRDAEIIRGLERGADDYMTKPFDARELAARIRKLLRRA